MISAAHFERDGASRAAHGFSLLELLVVMVILGLLVGLVGPRLFTKVDESRIQTAAAPIKMLRAAVDTMRLDMRRIPTVDEGLSLLTRPPADPAAAKTWRGPYIDDKLPVDPWGNAYRYAVPGADGQPYALYSLGADGKPGGTGDDADIGILPAN